MQKSNTMKFKNYKIIGLFLLIASCSDAKIKNEKKSETLGASSIESYQNKTLEIYTTAKDTDLRLTKTSEKKFKNKGN